MNKFRTLRADEIDCRVATVSDKGCSLLLYKDARCDQNVLDETVGAMNWQRHHSRDNANCIVSIWDADKRMWIEKEDTGTESNTEKEKGLASDSFKRACFNWGIGRELYTAPFIWISAGNVQLEDGYNGKRTTRDRFSVTEIGYDESGTITSLEIRNNSLKKIVFTFGETSGKQHDDFLTAAVQNKRIGTDKISAITARAEKMGLPLEVIMNQYGIKSIGEMTEGMFLDCVQRLNAEEKKRVRK